MPKKTVKVSAQAEEARIEYVRLGDIKRALRNPKMHDPAISASIRRHGFVAPLVENAKTGRIVAGHGRLEAVEAIKAETPDKPPARVKVDADGEWMVPVVRGVSFPSEQRAEEYLLADNRLVELGGWNNDALGTMLQEIARAGNGALEAIGYDAKAIAALVMITNPGQAGLDAAAEWVGMPECTSEDLTAWKNLIVNFASKKDLQAFAALVKQAVTPATRSIWFPPSEIGRYADKAYEARPAAKS